MHGIAFDGDTVFLATVNDVYVADVAADGSFGPLTRIINDLPDGGQHPNRTLGDRPGRDALHLGRLDLQRLRRDQSRERDDPARRSPTAAAARSSPRACATPSASTGSPTTGAALGHGPRHRLARRRRAGRGAEPARAGQAVRLALRLRHGRVQPAGQSARAASPSRTGPRCRRSRRSATPPHSAPMQMAFYDGGGLPGGVSRRRLRRDARLVEPPAAVAATRCCGSTSRTASRCRLEPFLAGFLVEQGRRLRLSRAARRPRRRHRTARSTSPTTPNGVDLPGRLRAGRRPRPLRRRSPNPILPTAAVGDRDGARRGARARRRSPVTARLRARPADPARPCRRRRQRLARRRLGRAPRARSPSSSSWTIPTRPSRSPSCTGSPTTSRRRSLALREGLPTEPVLPGAGR